MPYGLPGYQFNAPTDRLPAVGQGLAGALGQLRQRQQLAQQKQQMEQKRQAIGQIMQKHTDPATGVSNMDKAFGELYAVDPKIAFDVRNKYVQNQKARAETVKLMEGQPSNELVKAKRSFDVGTNLLLKTLDSPTPDYHWKEFLDHEYGDKPDVISQAGNYDKNKILQMIKNRKFTKSLYDKALTNKDPGKAEKEERKRVSSQANELRDEFTAQSKDYVKVRDAYGRIMASAKDADAAGDLSMIFNYMKMLDPGSVVRESEFRTAATAGAYGERMKAMVGQLVKGTRLSDTMRGDFIKRSDMLYEQQYGSQKVLQDTYRFLADELGVPSDLVIIPYEKSIKVNRPPWTEE